VIVAPHRKGQGCFVPWRTIRKFHGVAPTEEENGKKHWWIGLMGNQDEVRTEKWGVATREAFEKRCGGRASE